MTVSLWNRRATLALETELCVIGAGVCGLSAAIAAEARGVSVVVVERGLPGSGASTRNAGFLMRGAAENYARAASELGRERARFVWRWTEENLERLREIGIENLPSYERRASCLVALGPEEASELDRSAALMIEDGFETALISPGGDAPRDALWSSGRAVAGLLNPGDAVCDPAELIRFLASRVDGPVTTGQEVVGFGAAPGGGVLVLTGDGAVRAERALVCTNAYAGTLLPALRTIVAPRRGQMSAFRAPSGSGRLFEHAYYANFGSEYFRDGPRGTVIFGGFRADGGQAETGYEDSVSEAVQGRLCEFAAGFGVDPGDVVASWSGVMGFTAHGLPVVTPVKLRGVPEAAVWFCGGFTGHGMSMACRTAAHAVAVLLDNEMNHFPVETGHIVGI